MITSNSSISPTCAQVINQQKPAQISLFKSHNPKIILKQLTLSPEGRVEQLHIDEEAVAHGRMYSGVCVRNEKIHSLSDFANIIKEQKSDNAIAYGVHHLPQIEIVTQTKLANEGFKKGYSARTKEYFHWSHGPGIMMLDYDAPDDLSTLMGREQLLEALHSVAPRLSDAKKLWIPSSSSFIYDTTTGEQKQGLRGQRLYMLVQNSSDIPRAGKDLILGRGFKGVSLPVKIFEPRYPLVVV